MLSLDYAANSDSPVFQYLSQIETGNPRFPRKEDVMWYLICVCTMIIVSLIPRTAQPIFAFSSLRLHYIFNFPSSTTLNISARIVLCLPTIAVPGIEEDYPCTFGLPSFANTKKGRSRCGHGGMSLWMARVTLHHFARVVFLLPTFLSVYLGLPRPHVLRRPGLWKLRRTNT